MHLTRETMDRWAAHARPGIHPLRLEADDSLQTTGTLVPIVGPAVVELVVFRYGGWSARVVTCETPASIVATVQS